MRQSAAQAFIADDLVHAENLRCDFVAPQPRYMRITPLSIQNR